MVAWYLVAMFAGILLLGYLIHRNGHAPLPRRRQRVGWAGVAESSITKSLLLEMRTEQLRIHLQSVPRQARKRKLRRAQCDENEDQTLKRACRRGGGSRQSDVALALNGTADLPTHRSAWPFPVAHSASSRRGCTFH
jgi:hypothetical protein